MAPDLLLEPAIADQRPAVASHVVALGYVPRFHRSTFGALSLKYRYPDTWVNDSERMVNVVGNGRDSRYSYNVEVTHDDHWNASLTLEWRIR
jgi:hypothetical protein